MGAGASTGLAAATKAASDAELKDALGGIGAAGRAKLLSVLSSIDGGSGPAKGKGGMDTVVLRHKSGASAEVYLFGGTLCSYKSAGGKENIFVSPGAIWDGKKAIRGGVPLVFPQFGQPDKAMAQHGFARSSIWTLKEVKDADAESSLTLTLCDSDATREKWPHAFNLEFTAALTATSLKMTMTILNSGDSPFTFHALLHTYFQIPSIAEAAVRNLSDRSYVDKVAGGEIKKDSENEILLPSFTDRIYVAADSGAKQVEVGQKGGGAALFDITNEATLAGAPKACDVVVWNPYVEASPGDLPPPAYENFVCVEPGLVNEFSELAPKAVAQLSQTITPK